MSRSSIVRFALLGIVTAALVPPPMASAQLSLPSFTNNSNPNELFLGSATVPSFERETTTSLVSSAGGGFVTRFTALVTADGDGGPGVGLAESLFADYQVDFTATAPGAYLLSVAVQLKGDLHLVNDGANGGSADIGAVSALSTGGTIIGGALGLPDAGIIGGSSGASSSIDESNSATIFGVSNGSPVAHSLRFQWSSSASTDSTPGDEAAVRLGGTSDVASETAGDYPGSPARTQADDGHFVTVTITSLCGNSVIDNGPSYSEQCDEGSGNGQPGSCCAADCTFVTDGTPCSDSNACTNSDTCQSGVCTPGPGQTCPVCQTCDGNSGCIVGPRPSCKLTTAPLQAKLLIKDKTPDTGDQVQFKWNKGAATGVAEFGSPTTTDDYALCVFDPADQLIMQLDAPAGGVCNTSQCWKTLNIKGFAYKDSLRTPNGVDKVVLKAGLSAKAKVQLKGKGDNLPALPLPLPLPSTVQLQSENGTCFEGVFSTSGQQVNDPLLFRGKAD